MQNLKPCPYRHASEEGHILCNKIKIGDKQVSPNICRDCPVSAINCAHLRVALDHSSRLPITVRYGNGKTEVWDDVGGPAIKMERAACAAKVLPIHSPRDCAGCSLRQALVNVDSSNGIAPQQISQITSKRKQRNAPAQPIAPISAPVASQAVAEPVKPTEPIAEKRDSIVAQKIIKLQDWLEKQSKAKRETEPAEITARPIAVGEPRVIRKSVEEKRVGWTD
jgi:hypothetical protein